jgi:hypothetical protein
MDTYPEKIEPKKRGSLGFGNPEYWVVSTV